MISLYLFTMLLVCWWLKTVGRFMFSTRCNFSIHPNGSASHPTIISKSVEFIIFAFFYLIFLLRWNVGGMSWWRSADKRGLDDENIQLILFSNIHLFSCNIVQVSIRACEESRVMTWHRDKLKLTLDSDPFLQAVFDHILGRDVVRKLTQVSSIPTHSLWINLMDI